MTFACCICPADPQAAARQALAVLAAAGVPKPDQRLLCSGPAALAADGRRGQGPWRDPASGRLSAGNVAGAGDGGAASGHADPPAQVSRIIARYRYDGARGTLPGEFGVVEWDPAEQTLVAARDAFGVKPLYVLERPPMTALSDDLRALVHTFGSTDPDPVWIAEYLSGQDTDPQLSPYREIRRIAPGHALRLDPGGSTQYPAAVPGPELARRVSPDDLPDALLQALSRATTSRLDAATGCMLSGGLDSGSLAVLAAEARQPLSVLSMVYPDLPEVDESPLIQNVLASGRFRHLAVHGSGSRLDAIPALIEEQGQPVEGFNQTGLGALYDRAAEVGIDSMLDGHGGDEIIGTGQRHLLSLARDLRLGALWRAAEWPAQLLGRSRTDMVLETLSAAAPRHRLRKAAARLRRERAAGDARGWRALVSADLVTATSLVERARRGAGRPGQSDLDAHLALVNAPRTASAFETHFRTGRAHGMDLRYPFFDLDVVALCLGVTEAERLHGGMTRAPLRRAMAGRLPDRVRLRRDKTNFIPAAWQGLRASSRDSVAALREAIDGRLAPYVDRDVALAALDRLAQGGAPPHLDVMRHVWRSAQLAEWLAWLERLPRFDSQTETAIEVPA